MLWLPKTSKRAFTESEGTNSPFKYGFPNTLLEVSRALETDSYNVRNIRSIPDIYSKAHLFDMAIRQGDSNADDDFFKKYKLWVEYEWRAMLAVIVLAENLGVKVRTIPFYPSSNDEFIPAKFNDDGKDDDGNDVLSPLEKIIYRSRPTFEVWTKSSANNVREEEKLAWTWRNGLVFQVCPNEDDHWHPIAMTSPTTLIVPAADGWKTLWSTYNKVFTWIEPFAGERDIDPNKLVNENPVEVLKRDHKECLPILYSWLELYRDELTKKAIDSNWCPKKDNIGYLCGPFNGYDKDGILKRFLNGLDQTNIDATVKKVFSFTNIASILAPYIPNEKSEVEMPISSANGKRMLFIDCDAETIGGRALDNVIAIDRQSVKTIRDEHFKEKESKAKYDKGEISEKWISSLLNRIRSRVDLVFSDELLLPQVVYASYNFGNNQKICADAVRRGIGTWFSSYENEERTYWIPMPLTQEGFKFYNENENINYSVNGEYKQGSPTLWKININIDVPMSEKSANVTSEKGGYVYKWRKTYTNARVDGSDSPDAEKENEIRELGQPNANPCTAGIWPSRPVDGWQSYYFFCLKQGQFDIVPVSNSDLIMDPVGNPSTENPTYVDPNSNKSSIIGDLTYYRFNKFPNFLLLKDSNGTVLGYIPLETDFASPRPMSGTYKIAIDFGTSSTAIYRKMGDAKHGKFDGKGLGAAAICFNPLKSDEQGAVDYFTQLFVPHNSKSYQIPFQSLLHDFRSIRDTKPRRHIFDAQIAHILLDPQTLPINKNEIDSDLKWGNKAAGGRLDVFFRQLARTAVLDALMEGYDEIEVNSSYPGAKAGGNRQVKKLSEQFRSTINEDVIMIDEINGRAIKVVENPQITEGLAAALHFQSDVNDRFRCVIDIGGGTSDFFVYQIVSEEKSTYRAIDSSVKFGSREIFVDVLRENARKFGKEELFKGSLLYDIVSSDTCIVQPPEQVESSLKVYLSGVNDRTNGTSYGGGSETGLENRLWGIIKSAESDEGSFRLLFETLLAYPLGNGTVGDVLHESLTRRDEYTENNRSFLSILAVGIAAVAYYGGMIARVFTGSIDKIDLRFAGNGSKILRWLQFPDDELEVFLNEIFSRSLNRRDIESAKNENSMRVSVKISNDPKLEAASGMLSGNNITLDNNNRATTVTLSGESFHDSNNTEFSATEFIRDDHLFYVDNDVRKQRVYNTQISSAEFNAFVNAYNSAVVAAFGKSANRPLLVLDYNRDKNVDYGSAMFTFDVDTMKNNRNDDIGAYIRNVVNDKTSELERTPFFFTEVKTLIRSLIREFTK